MKIVIPRSGGVGGYFAGRLALPGDFAKGRLAFCDTIPATMTSSMKTDLSRGNRPELPWRSRGVVEMGKALGPRRL